jgi:ribosomal protein S18 acetylase RimI-like enzyme
MEFTFRLANAGDKEYVIDAIVEAEKGGHDIISYCSIFSLTEPEFRNLLGRMLDEDIEGQEVCLSNFMIAEMNGERAATLCAFTECKDGLSSNMLKTNMLLHLLGKDEIMKAMPRMSIMNEVNVSREPNILQFEYAFIDEKYRGQGLLRRLMDEHIKVRQNAGMQMPKLQLMILGNNIAAYKSHERYGFKVIETKVAQNKDILKLMSCDTKLLMEKIMT